MKSSLATAIATAIVGALIAYFGCNLFMGKIEDVSIKIIKTIDTDLSDPDPEVFNYKALNPTVEVYVGNCSEYDSNGRCLDQDSSDGIINLEANPESNNSEGTGGENPSNQPSQGNS